MNAFSSLFASVGGDADATKVATSVPPRPKSVGTDPRLPRPPPNIAPNVAGVKRKAENAGLECNNQPQRPAVPFANASKPTNGPRDLNNIQAKSTSLDSLKPSGTTSAKPNLSMSGMKNALPKSVINQAAAVSASAPTSTGPAKPAGRPSYRELLERAKTAKQLPEKTQVVPKQAQRLSRRERRELEVKQKEAAKQAQKTGTKIKVPVSASQQPKPTGVKSKTKAEEPLKPRRQPIELGYKGTMRAKEPTTSRTASARDSPERKTPQRAPERVRQDHHTSHSGRYRYVSESEEEEDDDEDDYESDGMEDHGFAALEEEEEASLRYARAEDAKALREEQQHKTEKLKRREALQALQSARKK